MAAKKTVEATPLHILPGTKMEKLKLLYDRDWYGCTRCPLHTFRLDGNKQVFHDVCFGEGNPESRIMLIGEAPGEEEQSTGIPFTGPSGRLLNQILAATSDDQGIQELYAWYNRGRHSREDMEHFHTQMLAWRRENFFITNVVACQPPENRAPTHPEVRACWERLYNTIYTVDPWLIITFGRPAIETLVKKQIEVTKLRGTIFDVEIPGRRVPYKVPTMACLHPSYLLRQADWKSKTGTYMKTVRDVHTAMRFMDGLKMQHLGTPLPSRPELP
jgi:uracil-DNA glycosylase